MADDPDTSKPAIPVHAADDMQRGLLRSFGTSIKRLFHAGSQPLNLEKGRWYEPWQRLWFILQELFAHTALTVILFVIILALQNLDEYLWPPNGHVFYNDTLYFQFHLAWVLDTFELALVILFAVQSVRIFVRSARS